MSTYTTIPSAWCRLFTHKGPRQGKQGQVIIDKIDDDIIIEVFDAAHARKITFAVPVKEWDRLNKEISKLDKIKAQQVIEQLELEAAQNRLREWEIAE